MESQFSHDWPPYRGKVYDQEHKFLEKRKQIYGGTFELAL